MGDPRVGILFGDNFRLADGRDKSEVHALRTLLVHNMVHATAPFDPETLHWAAMPIGVKRQSSASAQSLLSRRASPPQRSKSENGEHNMSCHVMPCQGG